ncbi:hypothetical protein M446_2840 [Methylobacterium sp. 4-46]|nr:MULTISPECIES: hypothetical protein [Methylobacterium]ACA17265.1 hypothetical protein M446_2840 [Methylobacterium sp. 4-46]WFT82950.1 hypothetical protein QA634_14395 [Methylobacterium nodulans]
MTVLTAPALAQAPAAPRAARWLRAGAGFAGSTALLILGMLTLGSLAA